MNSQPQSTPPGSHHRRSYTSQTQADGSKEVTETPKEQKKHRSRHSLHRHFSHPYRRLKESQQPPSTTLLGINPSKQLNERHENAPPPVPNESRRPSLIAAVDGMTDQPTLRDTVPPQDVERERQLIQIGNNELRRTLQSLCELSMSTTRNLDDIYYSILEKASTLQNTINSLQELSLLTKQLHLDLDGRADELKEVWQEQINSFGGFNAQKERIDGLDSRVKTSREKADKLSSRLQAAQERIRVLEVREGEWQATVNRRFTIFWTFLGGVVILIIAITIFNFTNSMEYTKTNTTTRTNSTALPSTSSLIPLSLIPILEGNKEGLNSSRESLLTAATPILEEDPRLRLFDEL